MECKKVIASQFRKLSDHSRMLLLPSLEIKSNMFHIHILIIEFSFHVIKCHLHDM